MPVGNVLVGDARGHIEHDDTALAIDVVSIAETTKLLLASRVPHIELDLAEVLQMQRLAARVVGGDGDLDAYGAEAERVNLDTEGGHVFLLELASQVTLDEGGLQTA